MGPNPILGTVRPAQRAGCAQNGRDMGLQMEEPVPRLTLVARNDHTIRDALSDFLLARTSALRSPRTVAYYSETLRPFLAYLEGEGVIDPRQMEVRHVRAFLAGEAKRVAPGTVHASARAIRAWVRFLERDGYLEHAPRFDMPRVPQKPQPVLSPEDVRLLLAACTSERDRALVLFLLDTGARRAEAQSVDWGDVNLETGVVRLRTTKGERPRVVILGARSRRAILRHRRSVPHAERDPLWQTADGLRLSYAGLREVLRRAGDRAGVKVTPHALRRTFATLALRGGMNLLHLAALMGHADLTMLRRYAVVVEEDLRRAHEASGPVDSLSRA